jgi:hypothetical protein
MLIFKTSKALKTLKHGSKAMFGQGSCSLIQIHDLISQKKVVLPSPFILG